MHGSECPLTYFWISLRTPRGGACSFLETHFDNVATRKGIFEGTCAVVGAPGRLSRDREILLGYLKKHKGDERQHLSLTISDCGYDYRTESGLRAVITRGRTGTLFDGDRRIGKVEGPTTAWLQNLPAFD